MGCTSATRDRATGWTRRSCRVHPVMCWAGFVVTGQAAVVSDCDGRRSCRPCRREHGAGHCTSRPDRRGHDRSGRSSTKSGRLFCRPTGGWIEPDWLSDHFDRLVRKAALPPIRLHDLRHGAATIALAAGTEMKVVQDMLGHSSISLTSDTYTSVLPELARDAAEAAARLVPRQGDKRPAGLTSGSQLPSSSKATNEKDRKKSKKKQVKASS
ncbi:tyrosine-type recombinase/integrase [Micromonospora zamorensis]